MAVHTYVSCVHTCVKPGQHTSDFQTVQAKTASVVVLGMVKQSSHSKFVNLLVSHIATPQNSKTACLQDLWIRQSQRYRSVFLATPICFFLLHVLYMAVPVLVVAVHAHAWCVCGRRRRASLFFTILRVVGVLFLFYQLCCYCRCCSLPLQLPCVGTFPSLRPTMLMFGVVVFRAVPCHAVPKPKPKTKNKDCPRQRRGARIGGQGGDDEGSGGAGRPGHRGPGVYLEGEVEAGRGEAPRAEERRGESGRVRGRERVPLDAAQGNRCLFYFCFYSVVWYDINLDVRLASTTRLEH